MTLAQNAPGYVIKTNADGSYEIEYGVGFDDPLEKQDQTAADVPNLGPHTVTLPNGKVFNRPSAQWRTLFRDPPVSDKVILSPEDLVDGRFMPLYGNPGAMLRPIEDVAYDGPNSFCDMPRYIGTTGETPGIGLVPERTAVFMMTGNANGMMQIAECAGTAPAFYIDKNTRAPINKETYPGANCFGDSSYYHGKPFFYPTIIPDGDPLAITMNGAHIPQLSYVPTIVTRSKWHLRNLQCWAGWVILQNGWVNPADGISVVSPSEVRGEGWGVRDIGMAWRATVDAEQNGYFDPAMHLPSSYFDKILKETMLDVFQRYINNPELQLSRIFQEQDHNGMEPWQQNYVLIALCFLVLIGRKEYIPALTWGLGMLVAMNNGTSGWPPCFSTSYNIYVGEPGARLKTWKDIWNASKLGDAYNPAEVAKADADQFNGGFYADSGSLQYDMGAHGAFSFALYLQQLGLVDLIATYPDLPTCYANVHRFTVNQESIQNPWVPGRNWFFDNRVAFSFDPAALPPSVVIQPTPVGTPPPEPTPDPQPQPENPPMSAEEDRLNAAVDTAASNEEKAVNLLKQFVAWVNDLIAAAQGDTITKADATALAAKLEAANADLAAQLAAGPTPPST